MFASSLFSQWKHAYVILDYGECVSVALIYLVFSQANKQQMFFFLAKQEQAEQGEAKQAEGRSLYRRGEDDDDVHGRH